MYFIYLGSIDTLWKKFQLRVWGIGDLSDLPWRYNKITSFQLLKLNSLNFASLNKFSLIHISKLQLTSQVDYENIDMFLLGSLLQNIEDISLFYKFENKQFEIFLKSLGNKEFHKTKYLDIILSNTSLLELTNNFWSIECLNYNNLFFEDLYAYDAEGESESFNSVTFYDFGDFDKTFGLSCLHFKIDTNTVDQLIAKHLQEFAETVRKQFNLIKPYP